MATHIVVAGGGFGGLYAARRLERRLPRHSARITMVTDQNFLLYTPLLPGAAAGTLEPRHVVVPLREELDWTEIRLARIAGADPEAKELRVTTLDGRETAVNYDQLIVSLGSVSRVLPVPGLAEYGVGFKTLPEAIALRNRAVLHLEIAEALEDPEQRRPYLTFVFAGAGYAGLEGIAELQGYVSDIIDRYPRCRLDGTRWVLLDAADRVMQETPRGLAEFATRELRARGMEILLNTRIDSIGPDRATLSTGEVVPTRTVCWTTGVQPPAVAREMGLPLTDGGRIDAEATTAVPGVPGVWAIGDSAAVPDPANKGKPSPATAQHVIRQAKVAADNVAATMAGRGLRKFRYRTLGVFVDMGRHDAVAVIMGVRLRGFPAWFAARTYHLALMPGLARRFRLVTDWTVGLFFGRASAELGALGHPPGLGEFFDPHETEPPAAPGPGD